MLLMELLMKTVLIHLADFQLQDTVKGKGRYQPQFWISGKIYQKLIKKTWKLLKVKKILYDRARLKNLTVSLGAGVIRNRFLITMV